MPAKYVSPWFYQVRPLDDTKTHYGALPAHRLLFPSRPSCFRERTVPKRPAYNPAYQRHGGRAQGRCSLDTRVPLRHPRFCKQSRGRYWRGFASSAAHCVPESRLPGSWTCCIGSQFTPSGCSDVGLVAGCPCSVSTQCDIWNTCQAKCTVPHTRYRRRSAGCRMRRWHQWPGPARPPVLLGPGSHAGVWQLQTLTHGAADVEFVSRIFHPPALWNRRPR